MAAAPAATLSFPTYSKLAISKSPAGLGSRGLILNGRRSSLHLPCKPPVSTFNSRLQATSIPAQRLQLSTGSRNKHLSASSMQFLGDFWPKANVVPAPQGSLLTTRAYKDDISKSCCPFITKNPELWLRILACVPYLIALQNSQVGIFLHPFLAHYGMFENLIYLVPGAINGFHPCFLIIYNYLRNDWVVKNKDLPHFIRFHTMMGFLLEIGLQVVWHTSNFFPFIHYNGLFGMQFRAATVVCFIILLLECVRSALGGKYAHIPFVTDAAHIHTNSI